MALDVAMGGSTNTVLHILAAAQEAEVDFDLADIDAISRRVPCLSKVAPNSDYHMEDVHRAGGIPAILGELRRAGLLDTGRPHGALAVASTAGSTPGTSAPAGAVRRRRSSCSTPRRAGCAPPSRSPRPTAGRALDTDAAGRLHPRRRARVHASTAGWPCCAATSPPTARRQDRRHRRGAVPLRRARRGSSRPRRRPSRRSSPSRSSPATSSWSATRAPPAGPGMQEMLYPTSFLKGAGLGRVCALITDGRFSGGTSGLSIGPHLPRGRGGRRDRAGRGRRPRRASTSTPARCSLDVADEVLAERRAKMEASERPWQPRDRDRAGHQGPARLRRAGHERAHGGGPPGAVTGRAGDRREWHTTRLLTGVRCLSTRSHGGGAPSPQTRAGGGGRRDHLPHPGGAEVVGGEAEVLDVDVHVGPVGARAAPRTTAAGRRPGPAASPGRAPRGRRGRRPSRSGCRPGRCRGGRRRGRACAAGGPGSR